MKKRVHLSECTDADVIAEDIITPYGALLLHSGTFLNKYIIQKISELDIEYVLIYDGNENNGPKNIDHHIFELKYNDCVNDLKNLTIDIVKGKKIDMAEINKITDHIFSEYEEPKHVLECLGKIRNTDEYTYHHCVNAAFYSMLIAGWLNLSRDDIKTVIQAGLLHDLGKAKIPNELLNKKEKLNDQEFAEIKRHAIYGYELVKDEPMISDEIKDAILMHHERENRSGYPMRAGGDALSIYTKIISVADVYDAMTSYRPYKNALTPFAAFEELMIACKGLLDFHITKTLLHNLTRYYTGSKVMLNNGQIGNIAYIPPHCIWKPIVDIGSCFLDLSSETGVSVVAMA